jgi:hypothetical protein
VGDGGGEQGVYGCAGSGGSAAAADEGEDVVGIAGGSAGVQLHFWGAERRAEAGWTVAPV